MNLIILTIKNMKIHTVQFLGLSPSMGHFIVGIKGVKKIDFCKTIKGIKVIFDDETMMSFHDIPYILTFNN